jgi:hypothetical protein
MPSHDGDGGNPAPDSRPCRRCRCACATTTKSFGLAAQQLDAARRAGDEQRVGEAERHGGELSGERLPCRSSDSTFAP